MPKSRRPRLVLLEPYLPQYRWPFYQRLERDLDSVGITLVVAHGSPAEKDQRARQDAVEMAGAVQLPQWSVRVAGRQVVYKHLGSLVRSSDVVVVNQALRYLELYPLLLRQLVGRGPVIAMWDHGRTYLKPQSSVELSLKYLLTRRARWFFAYTDGGARAVADHGFDRRRVTVVQNSVDTAELRQFRERVTESALSALRAEYGLVPGRTGLFIGALTASKRIPFLVEAVEQIADRLPGFRLLVAGAGKERQLVEAAAARTPGVIPVGQALGERKALLGAVSDVFLMPGLVGLCAVDSFALETPLVTTAWPWQAPEFEYLEDGRNALVAPDDPRQYADAVVELLNDPVKLGALQAECRKDALRYTVEEMSRRFAEGAVSLFESLGRSPVSLHTAVTTR